MGLTQSRENMIVDIINIIRQRCPKEEKDADLWDEGEGGVGWLDNEIGFAFEIIKGVHVNLFNECKSVQDVHNYLLSSKIFTDEFLKEILKIIKNGGTDNDNHWTKIEEIRKERKNLSTSICIYLDEPPPAY